MNVFIVVCVDGRSFEPATSTVFATQAEARRYAASVAQSRNPLVISRVITAHDLWDENSNYELGE
jgi:hypothetical protein